MINRPDYIEALEPFIDKPLVKILAGVRRCGKSTIFEMLKEEFLRRGVSMDHIICKRYTEMDIPENITAKQMYDELAAAMAGKGHCYLLLDEIQEIDGWEKAVNSLLESTDADIYVTGSKVYAKESSALKVRKPLFSEADKNLKEFLDFLKEEGVSRDKILFVRFPHVITNANLSRYQRGNTIGDIVRRYGYNFVSFEMDDEDINLDPYKDFYNIEHMNIYGQQKFSKFFAHYLQDNYDITPTSLTAKQKAEWDEAARWYDAYAAYNIDLIEKGEKKREISESYFIMQEIKKYLK